MNFASLETNEGRQVYRTNCPDCLDRIQWFMAEQPPGSKLTITIESMTEEDFAKQDWQRRYEQRLIDGGLSPEEAQADFEAGYSDGIPLEDDPEMLAENELSYMGDD
jgi:hypothetical protein